MGIKTVDVQPEAESMRQMFISWYNANVADSDCPKLDDSEVYIVWFCYIVGNAKALISTTRPDHMYYEVTYHENLNQIHIDSYKKVSHVSIDKIDEDEDDDIEINVYDVTNALSALGALILGVK